MELHCERIARIEESKKFLQEEMLHVHGLLATPAVSLYNGEENELRKDLLREMRYLERNMNTLSGLLQEELEA